MIYDTIKKLIFFLFCLSVSHQVLALSPLSRDKIEWSNSLCLPAVDNEPNIGVAGAFSGFIGNTLVIAGGANFPEAMPWEGGTKEWWNTIYYIEAKDSSATWEIAEEVLPDSRAYGVSVELPGGLLCIGGCDSIQCYKDVFLIRKKNRQIELSLSWPALPVPLANATGALLNNCIYVAGGQVSMKEQAATGHFYKLDLSDLKKGWQELATWPGEPRGYAVSAVQSDGFDKCFYLFSGRNYQADGTVKVLTDGFVYNPRMKSWKKLDRQFPVMAGTALPTGINHILLFGGVPQLIPGSADHPGFDNTVRLYHTITNTLVEREISPYILPVTTSIAKKDNAFYITSGEVKPGIRTPEIVQGEIIPFEKKLGFLNIAVIGIYFALLAWIGYYFSKRQKNTEDYFKGG